VVVPNIDKDLLFLPPADLYGEIEKARLDLLAERDRTLRALADFKNFRRRVEQDADKHFREGRREIILPLLGIVDDLEKALSSAGSDDTPLAQGVRLIHRKCLALLRGQGVQAVESIGRPFDPHMHEAVALAEPGEHEPGTVVDELRRGYMWEGEMIRTSQVRVAGE
jgi:molecular chaperone GrpE